MIGKLKHVLRRPGVAAVLSLMLAAVPAFSQSLSGSTSNIRALAGWILGAVVFLAAVVIVPMVIWAIISIRGDDYGAGVTKLAVALLAATVVYYGPSWISTITQQTVTVTAF